MSNEFNLYLGRLPDEFDECVLVLDEFDDIDECVPGDLGIDLELILVSDEYTNGTLNLCGLGIVRLVSELSDEFNLALIRLPDEFDLSLIRLPDEFDLLVVRPVRLVSELSDEFDDNDDSVPGDLGI